MRILLSLLTLFPSLALAAPSAANRLFVERAELSVALVAKRGGLTEKDAHAALDALARKTGREMRVSLQPREEYPGLGESSLRHTAWALSDAEREVLRGAKQALALDFAWGRGDSQALREIYGAIAKLAEKHDAFIYDRHAASAVTPAYWRTRRIEDGWKDGKVLVSRHVQVHMVPQENGLIMFDTGGLLRFGISDLTVLDVNRASVNPMGNLINMVSQRLLEGARPDARGRLRIRISDIEEPELRKMLEASTYPNAKRALTVAFVAPDVGLGAREEAVELSFPEIPCKDRGECMDGALKQLFGGADSTTQLKHDAQVLAARDRARQALMRYRGRVEKGIPPGEQLLVKAPFPFDKGNEWMWVDIHEWTGNTLRGRLENEPEYVDLKAGATVEVKLSDVMDYIYKLADGSFWGNEVGRLKQPEMFENAGGGRSRIRRQTR